jgi:flagellar biosynthesis protein FlhA
MAQPQFNIGQIRNLFSTTDLVFGVMIVGILGLIIVPLPTFIIDFLLALNLAFSLIILMVTMYVKEPLEFGAFPSVLLIITLLRVSLNIAASRLILSNNNADAGEVIRFFGTMVAGDNFVIGIVLFAIITIVNFIVITKGSERVAEVAARFTLDAMPGKQMSIDADLNAGLIDAAEARTRRRKIEMEASFYGSMDGANKFVRGDSIASIVIVLVNIIGGVLIGWLQRGYAPMDALTIYALATIGNGLVNQVPALLVAVATGLAITKSASEVSMGSDVSTQIFAQPRAFAFVCFILFVFALIPGTPRIPFMFLSLVFGVVAMIIVQTAQKKKDSESMGEEVTAKDVLKKPESILSTLGLDPLSLKAGRNLIPLIDPSQKGPLLEKITLVRYHIGQDLGFVIPGVRVMDDLSLPPNEYNVEIRGTKVSTGIAHIGHQLVRLPLYKLKEKKITGIETKDPLTGEKVTWVPDEEIPNLQKAQIEFKSPVDAVADHFAEVVKRFADEIMTRQNVQSLIELVKNANAAIVRELIPDLLSQGQVHKVLQLLIRERISIRDLSTIMEKLADYAHMSRDVNVLTEYVRQSLARQICESYADKDGVITVVTIDPSLEETLIGTIHQSEYGSFLAVDPHVGERILSQLATQMANFRAMKLPAVILCSPRLRPHFKRFIERNYPDAAVLSYNEIVPQIKVQSIGMISVD